MIKMIITITGIICSLQFANAQQKGGILGKTAPEIKVDNWVHIPEGQKSPTKESLKDKVIYMYCYQSWCPGCHSSGFPTLKQVSEKFKDSKDVEFIVVHTVFEGFSTNTPDKWKSVATRHGLQNLRFAHSGSKETRSQIMADYQTRGTPWAVIIGKDGKVKFNGFHIKPDQAIKLIDQLKKEQ